MIRASSKEGALLKKPNSTIDKVMVIAVKNDSNP